ncbi:MAG: cell division protein ZapE [Dongiaceae bacterium]
MLPSQKFQEIQQLQGLQKDAAQKGALAALDRLYEELGHYRPGARAKKFGKWLGAEITPPPKGLYFYGGVGRGKTLLMDLFFDLALTEKKRRCHFHEFMADVHQRLHWQRQKSKATSDDIVAVVAAEMAAEAWLVCFDEFQVYDIADAMILARFFTELFAQGVVMVATSNVKPDDLYAGGLHRERFLPFIPVLKNHCEIVEFKGAVDYRLLKLKELDVYYTPLGNYASESLDHAFAELTGGAIAHEEIITVKGRKIKAPKAAKGVAQFHFRDLCEQPLGASDYLELAKNFHTLILDGIPLFTDERRNEAKRFIILIDTLYDQKIRLICAAAAAPMELSAPNQHAFEFQRTASRLIEMQSPDYLSMPEEKVSLSESSSAKPPKAKPRLRNKSP